MLYVTYDTDGALTGSYSQELHPTHADSCIGVTESEQRNWVSYRANDARDGLEQMPAAQAPDTAAESIPMLNLQLVLIEDGKLAPAENAIMNMPGTEGQRARAYWNRALSARLNNTVVALLWPQLYEDEAAFLDAWRRAAAMDP